MANATSETVQPWSYVGEASRLTGFNQKMFYQWRKRACPLLAGRKLKFRRIDGRYQYWSKQISALIAATETADTIEVDGESYMTAERASVEFGRDKSTIHRASNKPHPALHGKRLARICRPGLARDGSVRMLRFFRRRDLSKIAEYDSRAYGPGNCDGWATAKKAAEMVGVVQATIYAWGKHGCPALKGKHLRSEMKKLKCGPTVRTIKVFDQEQLSEIRTKLTEPSVPLAPPFDLTSPNEWVYRDDDGGWGSRRYILRHYPIVRNTTLDTWRDHALIRAKRVEMPEAKGRWKKRWAYHLTDIETKVESGRPDRRVRYEEPYIDEKGCWLPDKTARSRYGIRTSLTTLRRNRRVQGQQIPAPNGNRRWGKLRWVYLEDDLKREFPNRATEATDDAGNGDQVAETPADTSTAAGKRKKTRKRRGPYKPRRNQSADARLLDRWHDARTANRKLTIDQFAAGEGRNSKSVRKTLKREKMRRSRLPKLCS